MMQFWCLVAFIHCLHINKAVCKLGKFNTKTNTVEFLNDLIHKQTETTNIALLTSHQEAEALYQLQRQYIFNQKTEVSISIIRYDDVNKDVVDTLRNYNIIDNLPVLYVAIQPKDKTINNINEVTKTIRRWDYKAKVAIVFHSKVNLTIYTEEMIYNTYLFTPTAGPEAGYTQYDVCQFCNKGEDALTLTNTWTKRLGFKFKVKFEDSFKGNFFGTSLTMGTWNVKPHIYVTGTDDKGLTTRDGFVYIRYMLLEELMNMKWNFKHATDGNKLQLLSSDNKPVGIMADLIKGKVEVVGGSWAGRYSRYQHADFSASSHYAKSICIISIEPTTNMPWFALLEAFKWHMWILILGSLLAVAVTTYVIRKYSRYSDKKATLRDCIWEPTVILCWDATTGHNPPWSICFLYSVYMLVCLVLVSLYMGGYTAAVISPTPLYPPVDSLNQLFKETDVKILTFGAWRKVYMKYFHNITGIEEKLEDIEYVQNESPLLTILKKLQKYPRKYVFIFTPLFVDMYALYFSQPGYRKFHYSKEGLPNTYCYLLYSNEFQFKETFNRKINLMHAMGFMKKSVIQHMGPATEVALERMNHQKEETELITFTQFWGALALLSSGFFFAFLLFFMEVAWKKCHEMLNENTKYRDTESEESKTEDIKAVEERARIKSPETSSPKNEERKGANPGDSLGVEELFLRKNKK